MKKLNQYLPFAVCALLITTAMSCNDATETNDSIEEEVTETRTKVEVPDWAKDAVIYELNIRQYTPEGTFEALIPHMARLSEMGVDIIWLMPIHPISETKRKGTLGSYYAVNGFREVNPEYGTLADLENLIGEIHKQDMKVLIDWVPHHTGWDHPWIKDHPEWFSQDSLGNIIDPINEETGEPWGWTDVAELDLSIPEMRKEIITDMIYWLDEVGIDGFRVDHAHGLPDDYWDEVSLGLATLDKPIFMLAEGEEYRLRNRENFIATYAWEFHHAMNDIAKGTKGVNVLDSLLQKDTSYTFGYHMYFTSNHDENSWAGTVMERMGDGHKTFAVLAHTIDGMPLIYSGQEEPITKRLEFFEKDDIEWKDYAYAEFYSTLNELKSRNKALWNGADGGHPERINESDYVYAFRREKDGDTVVVILNLSDQARSTSLTRSTGKLTEVFSSEEMQYDSGEIIELDAWQYIVLSNK